MGKIIFCIILWVMTSGACLADGLELTDIIKDARNAQIRQSVKDNAEKTVNQVKNTNQTAAKTDTVQTPCDNGNPEKLTDSNNQTKN